MQFVTGRPRRSDEGGIDHASRRIGVRMAENGRETLRRTPRFGWSTHGTGSHSSDASLG
jgi:hypothetical protein